MLMITLRHKILLLVCGAALLTALTTGAVTYVQTVRITMNAGVEKLKEETRLEALRLKGAYGRMEHDAFVASNTPPIQGIIRSLNNGDIDPEDNSSTALWRTRLETIFISVMKAAPYYTQMRYIGIADEGRELVRVNAVPGGGYERVAAEKLQQKAGEEYFQKGMKLPENSVYFSDITYNREHNKIEENLQLMLRTVYPVFTPDGRRFGMIVINADYGKLLIDTFKNANLQANFLITDRSGDYLEYIKESGALNFVSRHDTAKPAPAFVHMMQTSAFRQGLFENKEFTGFFVDFHHKHKDPGAYIRLFQYLPKDHVLIPAYQAGYNTLLLSAGLIFITLLLSLWVSRRFTAPLQAMTDGIKRARNAPDALNLPVHLHDEIGELARAFTCMADNLQQSTARLDAVINNAVDGIITVDGEGIIQSFNPACERLFGYNAEEATGNNIAMLMPEPHRSAHDGYLKHYAQTGEKKIIGIGREVEGRRKDGALFAMELSVAEYTVHNGRRYSGIIRDVTERKAYEKQLKKYTAELERSNRDLDDFAYIASHDLKEPLRGIYNHSCFLLEDNRDKLDEKSAERLNRLVTLSRRMEKLINDLLYFSRLGRQELAYGPADMNAILQDVCVTMQDFLEEKGARVSAAGTLPVIECDSAGVTEVFRNLIANAVKYNDKEKKEIEAGYLPVYEDKNGRRLYDVFYVKDNGIGIEEKFHDSIFRMFKRLKADKSGEEGTGAGLSFVKKIIDRHNGVIWPESQKNKGTVFYFTLKEGEGKRRAA